MAFDGAWLGIRPWDSLLMVQLNHEPPPESEWLSIEAMGDWIQTAPDGLDVERAYRNETLLRPDYRGHPVGNLTIEALNTSAPLETGAQIQRIHAGRQTIPPRSRVYEDVCRVAATRYWRFLNDHPEHHDKYLWVFGQPDSAAPGGRWLNDVLRDHGISFNDLEPTGFQMGWALNAARRLLELHPAPNPAIAHFETDMSEAEFEQWIKDKFRNIDTALKRGELG